MSIRPQDRLILSETFEQLASESGFAILDRGVDRHGFLEWSAYEKGEGFLRTVLIAALDSPSGVLFVTWAGIDTGEAYSRFPIDEFWVQEVGVAQQQLQTSWRRFIEEARKLSPRQVEHRYSLGLRLSTRFED